MYNAIWRTSRIPRETWVDETAGHSTFFSCAGSISSTDTAANLYRNHYMPISWKSKSTHYIDRKPVFLICYYSPFLVSKTDHFPSSIAPHSDPDGLPYQICSVRLLTRKYLWLATRRKAPDNTSLRSSSSGPLRKW